MQQIFRFLNLRFVFIAGLIVALFALGACMPRDPEMGEYQANWREDYDAALAEAKAAGKPVLINFTGSDWCPPCKAMEAEVFTQRPFVDYAENGLVLVRLDFPRFHSQEAALAERNKRLASEWNIDGFPTFVVLGADGKPVRQWTGYTRGGAEAFVTDMKMALPGS